MTDSGGDEDRVMSKWQEIGAAPNDEETEVLIYDPDHGIRVACWYGSRRPNEWIGADDLANHVTYTPTHWMPLPEEPEE
jgi:hypothetical protein